MSNEASFPALVSNICPECMIISSAFGVEVCHKVIDINRFVSKNKG